MNALAQNSMNAETSPWLARAQQGDAEAFCELCRPLETPLRQRALALCGDPVVADELAQDTLVSAWKSLARFDGRCQLLTWLCAILLHHYRSRLRRPWWRRRVDLGAEFQEGWADDAAPPDEALVAAEQAAWMRECLACLPPKQREVVFMRFFNNESLANIAAGLNCSLGTVKSRLFTALERMRRLKFSGAPRKRS